MRAKQLWEYRPANRPAQDAGIKFTMACWVALAMESRGLPAKLNHDGCTKHVYSFSGPFSVVYSGPCRCECHSDRRVSL